MKLFGTQVIFALALITSWWKETAVFAQNNLNCNAGNNYFQCPNPGGTIYTDRFDFYVNNVSLSDPSASLNPIAEITGIFTGLLEVAVAIASGFNPNINALNVVTNYALSYTSLSEEEEEFPLAQIEVSLNNIVQNFNAEINSAFGYINERFSDLQTYTQSLIQQSTYLSRVLALRRDVVNELKVYQGDLETYSADGAITTSEADDLEDLLLIPAAACRGFFGSTDVTPSPANSAFDEIQSAMDRLVYAQEMCSGCLAVYSAQNALDVHNNPRYFEDLQFTMERCVLEVIPLVREHIQDEVDKITFFEENSASTGMANWDEKAGGEYDNKAYFGYEKKEALYQWNYPCAYNCGAPFPCFQTCSNFFKAECYSTCDRIKSCTNNEFANHVDYICTQSHTAYSGQHTTNDCPGYNQDPVQDGAYPVNIAGACVGFGKMQIDNELMNFYRSSLMHGYGDVWANALASANPQGLILSSRAPFSEGPFALQSRHWGTFLNSGVNSIGTIGDGRAYFNFIWKGDATYEIQSSDNNGYLCDGSSCEWTVIPMTSSLVSSLFAAADPTLYTFQNTGTGGYLSPVTEPDFTQVTGNKYRNEALIEVSTSQTFDLAYSFRLIRQCPDLQPGSCLECQQDSDCSHGYSVCDTSQNICVYKTSPAFTSKEDLKVALDDPQAAYSTYGPISGWDVSQIANFDFLFEAQTTFNEDISQWDTSAVTSMIYTFLDAHAFNQDIGSWDVSKVTSMEGAFRRAYVFDRDIGGWDVSAVSTIKNMFWLAEKFNQNIGSWDVSKVVSLEGAFVWAYEFNQNIGGWDVSSVTNMKRMFFEAETFNQDIGSWDVSSVLDMTDLFARAYDFDQPLGGWDVSSAENMERMFVRASKFNQNIGGWDTSKVTTLNKMFFDASNFNQDINNWDVAKVVNVDNMLTGAGSFSQNLCWDTIASSVDTTSIGVPFCFLPSGLYTIWSVAESATSTAGATALMYDPVIDKVVSSTATNEYTVFRVDEENGSYVITAQNKYMFDNDPNGFGLRTTNADNSGKYELSPHNSNQNFASARVLSSGDRLGIKGSELATYDDNENLGEVLYFQYIGQSTMPSGYEQCSFERPNGVDYCNKWCNTSGIWGCGTPTAGSYTCDCSGCNGCA